MVVVPESGMGPERGVKVCVCVVKFGRRHVLRSSNRKDGGMCGGLLRVSRGNIAVVAR